MDCGNDGVDCGNDVMGCGNDVVDCGNDVVGAGIWPFVSGARLSLSGWAPTHKTVGIQFP